MKFVYLVVTYYAFTSNQIEIVKAFRIFDKAEDFVHEKQKVQTDYSYEYVIETIAVDEE